MFEFSDAFSDSVKRAAQCLCLLLERIEFLALVYRRCDAGVRPFGHRRLLAEQVGAA